MNIIQKYGDFFFFLIICFGICGKSVKAYVSGYLGDSMSKA